MKSGVSWRQNSIKQASSKRTREQEASKQASKPSKRASKPASEQASKERAFLSRKGDGSGRRPTNIELAAPLIFDDPALSSVALANVANICFLYVGFCFLEPGTKEHYV